MLQSGLSLFWVGFMELKDIKDELQKKREKLHEFEDITEKLSEKKSENARLRQLLNLQERVPFELYHALLYPKTRTTGSGQ